MHSFGRRTVGCLYASLALATAAPAVAQAAKPLPAEPAVQKEIEAGRLQKAPSRGTLIKDDTGTPVATVEHMTDGRITMIAKNHRFTVPLSALRNGIAPAGLVKAFAALDRREVGAVPGASNGD